MAAKRLHTTCIVTDLVHLDVVAVEVQTGNPVLNVCLPPHSLSPEVEKLDVAVIVARGQAAVFVRVSVSKCNGPTVPCGLIERKRVSSRIDQVTKEATGWHSVDTNGR